MNPLSNTVAARAGRRLWGGVLTVDRFARLHFLFFSGLLPLLGASTVCRHLRAGQIVALLGVRLCFHIYSSVLNGVVDLPIDPPPRARQTQPLERGTLNPCQA